MEATTITKAPLRFLMVVLMVGLALPLQAAAVSGLRCEGSPRPLGLDIVRPRLSWRMEDNLADGTPVREQRQTAYRVLVSSTKEKLAAEEGDLWDSGKVDSAQSLHVAYSGQTLTSGTGCFWKIRLWDKDGQPTDWSQSAFWKMGLLKPEDWQAQWIGVAAEPAPVPPDVTVTKATYRTLDGEVAVDVTPIMKRVVEERRLPFKVDFNQLGGDPAPNIVKELELEYTLAGRVGVSRARDFEMLGIPQAMPGVPALWFRGEFDLTSAPESAYVTVHSPAYFELHVNGEKIGDDVLMPAVSDTHDRTFVVTYEVTRHLKPGKNCLGIWAAKGWADHLVLRAQLEAVVQGRAFIFGTGPSWKSRPSNLSHIGGWNWHNFGGEHLEAGRQLPDWAKAGADPAGWRPVAEAAAPSGKGEWQAAPANRIGERITPVSITPLAEGRYEIDFGRIRFLELADAAADDKKG